MLGMLIVAWLLSLFGFDDMVCEVVNDFSLPFKFTISHYYVIFAIIGLVLSLFGNGE